MDLVLTETSKELLENLDVLYEFYETNKDEHIEIIDNKTIDHILIATQLSLSDAPLPQLDKVYIKKSNVEGLGVFAKEDLKKGEIVSLYPSDIVRLHFGQFYNQECNEYVKDIDENNRYAYKINDYCTIMGDPTLIHDMNLVGHIVNDSCKTDGTKEQNYIYDKKAHHYRNCMYYPYHIFVLIVTTKEVKKDEELLVMYGIDYWTVIQK
jgi:hypothetical protein